MTAKDNAYKATGKSPHEDFDFIASTGDKKTWAPTWARGCGSGSRICASSKRLSRLLWISPGSALRKPLDRTSWSALLKEVSPAMTRICSERIWFFALCRSLIGFRRLICRLPTP